MKKIKVLMMRVVASAAFAVAITTVASTSRCFAFQPESDNKVMKKYMRQ